MNIAAVVLDLMPVVILLNHSRLLKRREVLARTEIKVNFWWWMLDEW